MKNKTKQNLLDLLANDKIYITAEDVSTKLIEINSSSSIEIDNIVSNFVINNYIYYLSVGEDVYCFDFNSKQEIQSKDFIVIEEYRDQDHYPDLTKEEFNYYQQLTTIAKELSFEKKHEIKENIIKKHKTMELKTKTLVNALNQIDFDKKPINESSNLLFLNTIENKLSLNYTHHSLDTTINILIDCEVASNINIAIDIQEFIKLVKTIKSDTIVLSIDCNKLKINNYSISIKDCALRTSFEKEYTKILEMHSNQFVKMLNQVKPAMSKDGARYDIKGININSKNNKLNVVSTDGKCMMLKTADIQTQEINNTIPDFAVKQIIKAFKSDELIIISLAQLTQYSSFLKIESNNTTVILSLIDCQYPDYTKCITGNEVVIVNKKELMAITQEAGAITTDNHNIIIFNFENNILEIKVKEQNEIRYSNKMTIEGLVKLEIGFNARLLLNILKSIDDDIITLKLKDSQGIMQIEADNFTGLIMPILI